MEKHLYPKHGLSGRAYKATYERLYAQQEGRCGVCGRQIGDVWHFNSRITLFVIDHSHTTGRIRALLCSQCNTHVGNVENGKAFVVARMNQPIPYYLEVIRSYLAFYLEDASETEKPLEQVL